MSVVLVVVVLVRCSCSCLVGSERACMHAMTDFLGRLALNIQLLQTDRQIRVTSYAT